MPHNILKPEELDTDLPVKSQSLRKGDKAPNMSPAASIFALTIGIDSYRHCGPIIKNLAGCVADADDIDTFLIESLRVPSKNIKKLRNEHATASDITLALESLATDSRIPEGAIIFIYYAGHGTEAFPPKDWPSNGKIQTLVPHDFDPGDLTRSEIGAIHGSPVAKNGLADIKLSQLLEHIANKKGNHITVVFDSCHSGSGTRHSAIANQVVVAARGIDLPEDTQLDANALPIPSRGSRGSTILERNRNSGLASHILFAACTEFQSAYESSGRGAFTSAFLNLLRSEDTQQLTYSDIIKKLTPQSPQCEGINQHLTFLHNHAASVTRTPYNFFDMGSGDYKIDAGEAHGVTRDAEFVVYDTEACTNALGCFVVRVTETFDSTLRPIDGGCSPIIPKTGAFAVQTRMGIMQDVRMLVESNTDFFRDINEHLRATDGSQPLFKFVATRDENPDLIVSLSANTVRFEISDIVCRNFGMCEIMSHLEMDKEILTNVLRGVGHFYWNLHRKPFQSYYTHPSYSRIVLECYELKGAESVDSNDASLMMPTGDNLLVGDNIQIGIDDSEKCHGFRITNTTNTPLFVSVFYFNMSDFSVDVYYLPPSAGPGGHFESLSPCNGFLTIGYGSGGSQPFSFYLNEDQDVDVGYIKIFLSTEYVDYSSVSQKSPFHRDENRGSRPYKPSYDQVWDTMLIPIVQRRKMA